MVGCADDTFVNDGVNGSEGLKGKLVEAGLLGVDRTEGEAATRVYNPLGGFVWMPSVLENNGSLGTVRTNQKIGMCWTGRAADGYGAVTTLDQKVYTNYEYEHVGWLDVNATAPEEDPCEALKLMNGAFIVGEGQPVASFSNSYQTGGRWNAYYSAATQGTYTATSHEESTGTLDLSRGVFKTNNASVFVGEYLVYYPYTSAFTKGQILANEPTTFEVDQTLDRYAAASDAAFSIGYLPNYAGGNASSGLKARTLNGFLGVKLYNYASIKPADKKIKQVIFYSEEGGILYQQDLDASKCVTALSTGAALGSDLYYTGTGANSARTNAVVANLIKSGTPADAYATVSGSSTSPATNDDYVWVVLPVLPQTINGLQVIFIDEDDMSCTLPFSANEIKSNSGANILDFNLATCTFKNEYLAVDEESFLSAMNKIKTNGSTLADENANQVKLLKDIRLTFDANDPKIAPYVGSGNYAGTQNSLFFDRNITIYSKANSKLIVAAETKMNIKNLTSAIVSTATDRTPKLTIDVPVVVEGAGCCDGSVAKLSVGGAQSADKACTVTFTKDIENYGTLALGNNAAGNTDVTVKGTITNKLDEYATKRSMATDAAKLYLLGGQNSGTSTIDINTIENDGEIFSYATSIAIDGTDVVVNDPKNDGSARVVTSTIDVLNNRGTVTVDNRTLVNVTSSLKNEEATSLIKIEGVAASATDGRIDVKGTSSNVGIIDNSGVVNFNANSLANTGLFIDQLSGQVGGKKIDNGSEGPAPEVTYGGVKYTTDIPVKGIYVSRVASVERLNFALTDAVEQPSTVIIEIMGCDQAFYNLETVDPEDNLQNKDVYINAGARIAFKAYKYSAADAKNVPTAKSFGHCVTVLAGNTLLATEGTLSTVNNVYVNSGATLNVRAAGTSNPNMEVEVTIGGNLENEGTTTHTAKLLTVSKDLNNSGSFTSKQSFKVGEDVTTTGTFDSDGTPNTVGGNFTQDGGTVTFAYQTTTTISGTFACTKGTFEREGLNGSSAYRATVNVGDLGALSGTTSTAWPTQM